MSVPTKSQNPTICGWGDLFQSYLTPFLRVLSISGFLKVIHAPKTPKRGFFQVHRKSTSSIAFFKSLQSGLPINLINIPMMVLGAWMTFKKPEMDKNLRNGLSMSETDPKTTVWFHDSVGTGIAPVKKKLLLKAFLNNALQFSTCLNTSWETTD